MARKASALASKAAAYLSGVNAKMTAYHGSSGMAKISVMKNIAKTISSGGIGN